MNSPRLTQSPTGRLNVSMPEMQFFPGTPQALAQSRKLRIAREAATRATPLVACDYSELELRALQSYLDRTH
ncbi:hypothetical protein LC612_41510 [Nostoc sp. CHAB 5834]|nr:hypothetical protein [Nostoc sp. CHAB 5834]